MTTSNDEETQLLGTYLETSHLVPIHHDSPVSSQRILVGTSIFRPVVGAGAGNTGQDRPLRIRFEGVLLGVGMGVALATGYELRPATSGVGTA